MYCWLRKWLTAIQLDRVLSCVGPDMVKHKMTRGLYWFWLECPTSSCGVVDGIARTQVLKGLGSYKLFAWE